MKIHHTNTRSTCLLANVLETLALGAPRRSPKVQMTARWRAIQCSQRKLALVLPRQLL
jgi:hypothetical protein